MNDKTPHRRILTTLALLGGALLFAGNTLKTFAAPVPSVSFQDTQADSTEMSTGRKLVANNYGYWAFGNHGFPSVSFSTDTVNWKIGHIFGPTYNDSDGTTMMHAPAIYYCRASSMVYVIVMSNHIPLTASAEANNLTLLYIASAQLNQPGLPASWNMQAYGIDSQGAGTVYDHSIGAEEAYSITGTEDPGTGLEVNLWVTATATRDSSTRRALNVAMIDPDTLIMVHNRGDSWNNATAVTSYYSPVIVQADNGGPDVVVFFKKGRNSTTTWAISTFKNSGANNINNGGPDVTDTVTTIGTEAAGTRNDLYTGSCVFVSTAASGYGQIHCAAVDGNAGGVLKWARYQYTGAAWSLSQGPVTVDAGATTVAHPSLGLLGTTTAYIVYEGTWTASFNAIHYEKGTPMRPGRQPDLAENGGL